ncbi:MAG TPA: chemotaxis protein CheW [Terracidiphilus sp.]|jgi:purine-binding chemotaxis protein CheW|nr:chemotaxis protein CheW [Terracidiphilus sp.]
MSLQEATQHSKGTAAPAAEMCSVRLGEGLFGIPLTHVLEIVGSARPQPVPLAPRFVGGLVHYRGDVLTTVSLRYLLDLPPRDGPQDILVVESEGRCFGLLVDGVGEVLVVSPDDYEPNPSTVDEKKRKFFAGACKLREGLMVLLDPALLDPIRLAKAA